MRTDHRKPGDYLISTWSGGTTRQLVIGPPEARYAERDFLFRISSATVDLEESDFTLLPDYERHLCVLEGSLRLLPQGGAETRLAPYAVYRFDGGVPIHAVGRCVDFNLMVRKGAGQGSLTALQEARETRFTLNEKKAVAFYCAKGRARVMCQGEGLDLMREETGLYCGAQAYLLITPEPGSVVLAAEVQT